MDGFALGIQQMASLIKYKNLANKIAEFAEQYTKGPDRTIEKILESRGTRVGKHFRSRSIDKSAF